MLGLPIVVGHPEERDREHADALHTRGATLFVYAANQCQLARGCQSVSSVYSPSHRPQVLEVRNFMEEEENA